MAQLGEIIPEKDYIQQNNNDSSYGFLAGVILLILFILMLVSYILPAMRNTTASASKVNAPHTLNINGTK